MAEGFGTDIGGVLAAHATLEFLEQAGRHLAVPEIEGGFAALRRLSAERFGDQTYVISMCDEEIEVRSREWLTHTNFLDRTSLSWDRVIYCRTFEEKAIIAGELGLTHFADDRLQVLGDFNRGERLYLFRPNEQECARFAQHLGKVSVVQSWDEILADALTPR